MAVSPQPSNTSAMKIPCEHPASAAGLWHELIAPCCDLGEESLWLFILDEANNVTAIHPAPSKALGDEWRFKDEVFRASIMAAKPAFLLMHFRPGGIAQPDEFDIARANALIHCSHLGNAELVDYIIVTDRGGDFYSFRDLEELDELPMPFKRKFGKVETTEARA